MTYMVLGYLQEMRARVPERLKRLARFVISGGTGFVVHFGVLISLVQVTGMDEVVASVCGFLCAFGVSFTLQKFWTFKERGLSEAPMQMTRYLGIAVINLGINAGLMHLLVKEVGMYYIFAQFVTTGLIAVGSYFLYKHVVFTGAKTAVKT